ncbi:MAG: PKD domain-containing protein [Saprospiraceae bacterium]|nr:PKD domain-containing protein [Saprospiraceae bacterium]
MRLRLLPLFALLLFFHPLSAQKYREMIEAGTFTLDEIRQEAEAYFQSIGTGRGTGYKPYKRWEYVAQMELDASGVKIPNFDLAQHARNYRRAERQRLAESSAFAGDWKQLGPTYKNATSGWNPGVGRVTSIGIDATNKLHLIIGSPTGGVWKTLDGGQNWTPLTDDYSTVDVYALEISPYNSNHYLWGSTSGRIYRSTDGGATWTTTGNVSGSGRVSRIQFHPTNSNIVYAVSESSGLYRSTNGGANWTAVSGASGTSGYDVEFKPGDPNTIYFSGRNVYRSTNGGTSFSQISGFGTSSNNYKMMGVSPANPNVVYVLESNGGRFGAFYKSTNSGASFTKLIDGDDINFFGYSATGDDDRGQAPRDMDVAVRLSNADEVHIAGIHTWKSLDGGQSFFLTSYWVPSTAASLGVGYNHADVDILKFSGDTLYVGTDGGFYRSTDGAASFDDLSTGLCIREFYKIGVSKTNPNVVSGGAQDNGTSVMRTANRTWVDWLGADGMETFVDWSNANNLYGTSQNGSMYRSTNQGNTRSNISKPPDVEDGAWITPFEQDPQVANIIYAAFADVWRSTNNGSSWTKISNFDNGNFNHMKLAPSDNQRIYVARGSSLFTTANGGGTWTTIASAWGGSTINFIAVHPQNPQRLLIVTASAVYHSTNAGSSWTNIGGGLPSGTKYCAVWEDKGKNGIYVGGFGFVAYTNDDLGGQWTGFFDGLPNARVYELEINYLSNTIFAGTYGRGLWESPLFLLTPPEVAFEADRQLGCRSITVQFTDKSDNNPNAWNWTFDGGTPATSTEQNPVVTFNGVGTYTVQLTASNHAGANSYEAVDYIVVEDPAEPVVTPAERCGPGEVSLQATGGPGEQIRWYTAAADIDPLHIGELFTTNVSQTTSFYAAAGTGTILLEHVGPASNAIGNGGAHIGNFFLIFDAEKSFRLKSAKVYATGAANRTFQLRDAAGTVLLEKTIFVEDGESRVDLDMDIPVGTDLQIGCPTPADLYRNNSGVNYPYAIPGLMEIKSSTAGPDYYYYLYDIEVEHGELCESDRVAVSATINLLPDVPVVSADGSTTLCPGESVVLTAENICSGCTVLWSNGETTPAITVSDGGIYTAMVGNVCGDSPASEIIEVAANALPEAPVLSASGNTLLCPGESVVLTVENLCSGCTVEWSNDETTPEISVSTQGAYSATVSNACGSGPVSEIVAIGTTIPPAAAEISAMGNTLLCPGESVLLLAENICAGCSILWSNGETTPEISVSTAGNYTAVVSNNTGSHCSESLPSNAIAVAALQAPDAPAVVAAGQTSLCNGESVVLSVANLCAGCTVLWSNDEITPEITVSTAGMYSAIVGNSCGQSPASTAIEVTIGMAPNAPVLSATATVLCPGQSAVLTAGNVCAGCSVQWSNGATTPAITVSSAGAYTATVHNDCGDSPVSEPVSFYTETLPDAPVLSASGSTLLCPGDSVVLMAESSCSGCSISWSNGATGPEIAVFTSGLFTAMVGNVCGDSPVSGAITVSTETLPETPVVSASGNSLLCPGESVVLTVENVCANCSVLWSNGETTRAIEGFAEGAYTATVQNVCGESPVSEAINITTGILPEAPVLSASASTTLCPGESVVLTAENICSGCTILWSTGETTADITVSTAGEYTATVGNACGDSPVSESISVLTNTLPDAPVVSASGATALCPGESVVLTAGSICAGCTVLWSNGETTSDITVSGEGAYTANFINNCGAGPASESVNVTVYPPFEPVVQVLDLCHLSAPPGSNYQWYLNGDTIPGANAQFWTAATGGQYAVSMDSPEGCSGISGEISAEACASSTANLAGILSAKLYPNPAVDRIFWEIQTQEAVQVRIELYSADGRFVATLHQGEILPGGQTLDIALPELPTAVYRYRLVTELGVAQGNLVVLRR